MAETTDQTIARMTAEIDDLRALVATCVCPSWPPDGPAEDCPVHGAVKAFNDATAVIAAMRPVVEAAQGLVEVWRLMGSEIQPRTAPSDLLAAVEEFEATGMPPGLAHLTSADPVVGEETSRVFLMPQKTAEDAGSLVAGLLETSANLAQHIEDRAREIAATRIAQMESAAAGEVAYHVAQLDERDHNRAEIDRLRKDLAEAQATIRALVEPGGRWETEYAAPNVVQRRVFYGPPMPIVPGEPGQHGHAPPAGDNDHGDSWGDLPHPPWSLHPVALEAHDAAVHTVSGATPTAAADAQDPTTEAEQP